MNTLQQWQWIGMLLARLAVGLLFAISGGSKLFVRARREEMQKTLVAAHIPAPDISALIVSLLEFVFGALLVVGLLTRLCCLVLTANMIGALSTAILPGIKAESAVGWLGEFLYLPEVLYVVILVWLFFSGPGRFSLDHAVL